MTESEKIWRAKINFVIYKIDVMYIMYIHNTMYTNVCKIYIM